MKKVMWLVLLLALVGAGYFHWYKSIRPGELILDYFEYVTFADGWDVYSVKNHEGAWVVLVTIPAPRRDYSSGDLEVIRDRMKSFVLRGCPSATTTPTFYDVAGISDFVVIARDRNGDRVASVTCDASVDPSTELMKSIGH